MLGLGARSHTAQNLLREKECVLNLPSIAEGSRGKPAGSSHRLRSGAPTQWGYHEKDKLG